MLRLDCVLANVGRFSRHPLPFLGNVIYERSSYCNVLENLLKWLVSKLKCMLKTKSCQLLNSKVKATFFPLQQQKLFDNVNEISRNPPAYPLLKNSVLQRMPAAENKSSSGRETKWEKVSGWEKCASER